MAPFFIFLREAEGMDDLAKELNRLGCCGQQGTVSVKMTEAYRVLVWDPDYDPDCDQAIEVDPEQAAKLLALLPDGAPVGECEGEEGQPSVWDVLLSLSHVGYEKTTSWVMGCR